MEIEVVPTMARDKLCVVTFSKVRVSRDNILGKKGQGWDIVNFILQRAIVLKCAEVLGACEAVMEMTNAYVKGRVQFDRPIGSFQAVQHRMVDRFIDIEGLRYLVYEAAWEVSIGSASDLHISMAKAKANEIYQRTCIDCIKNYGAIGFTADQDIGLYYRRVKAAEFFLGDTDFHRERVAVGLGL
jgi:alkylation response protein AidB-like acyl-CoA dehydrogenase